MATTQIDESAEAFVELLEALPSTITFNGLTKDCVSQSLNLKRAQQLQGYELENAQEVTMLASDFADFEGITDRVSKVSVNDEEELIFLMSDRHVNSATVHLFLVSAK